MIGAETGEEGSTYDSVNEIEGVEGVKHYEGLKLGCTSNKLELALSGSVGVTATYLAP